MKDKACKAREIITAIWVTENAKQRSTIPFCVKTVKFSTYELQEELLYFLVFYKFRSGPMGVHQVRPLDSSETPIMPLGAFPQTYIKSFCFSSHEQFHSFLLGLRRTMMPQKHFLSFLSHQSTYTQTFYFIFFFIFTSL